MKNSQLRDYLLSLILAGVPSLAACDAEPDLLPDASIDASSCDAGPHRIIKSAPDGGIVFGDAGTLDCATACPNSGGAAIACAPDPDGISIDCEYPPLCFGRRPQGLVEPRPPAETGIGGYLARAAHLEAASVIAFDQLAIALRAHGAPSTLIARATTAARDERRHATIMAGLARRYGASVPRIEVASPPLRTLHELALENVREGCVGEAFGALLALHQARAANAPEIRRAMAAIAEDEVAHAELALALAAWLEPQLTDDERAEVNAAREAAIFALEHAPGELSSADRQTLGLPASGPLRRLAGGLRDLPS